MPFSRHWEVSGYYIARQLGHSDDKQFSLSAKREGLTQLWADKAKWLFTKLFVLDLP